MQTSAFSLALLVSNGLGARIIAVKLMTFANINRQLSIQPINHIILTIWKSLTTKHYIIIESTDQAINLSFQTINKSNENFIK